MPLNITHSATVSGNGDMSAKDIKEFIKELPGHAKITASTYNGDQREPVKQWTLTAKWSDFAVDTAAHRGSGWRLDA